METKFKKVPSGISGFDSIAHGGLPEGRTTLVSGTSGSGKTVFAAQFLYRGYIDHGQSGVFVTFEETPNDISKNMEGFGWDIHQLVKENHWSFVDVSPDETDRIEAGQYDLSAFLNRIEYAIKKVRAKRVAIDSVSSLFTHFQDQGIIRRELYKLIGKLKKLHITCIMTAERPVDEGHISRYGVEEFVSDNVIMLHYRLNPKCERDRTIEILKFRGSIHESEEAPFIVSDKGMIIYPRLKPKLMGRGFSEKVSTGIKGLDDLLYGGVYINSTTLLSGASGTGKTVATLHFIIEGARRGEESLMIEFEESPDQLYRNAASFGWDLQKHVEGGVVDLICNYPEDLKPEQYLQRIQELIIEKKTKRVVLDPMSALKRIYNEEKFREFVIGLNAFLKMNNVTALLTNTISQLFGITQITESHLSTATDNIIILKYVELGGRMRRLLSVIKQRGSRHKKELIEFEIDSIKGLVILQPFEGVENLMSGSGRMVNFRFNEADANREFLVESGTGRI
jgi:circadian clock protein KaiC